MRFIAAKEEYKEEMQFQDGIYNLNEDFPESVFRDKLAMRKVCEGDSFLFEGVLEMARDVFNYNGTVTRLAAPHSEKDKAHFDLYRKYPVIMIEPPFNNQEFEKLMYSEPNGNIVDAFIHYTSVFLVYSNSFDWGIYIDRTYELAVFACNNFTGMDKILSSFNASMQYTSAEDLKEHFNRVVGPRYRKTELKSVIRNYFCTV